VGVKLEMWVCMSVWMDGCMYCICVGCIFCGPVCAKVEKARVKAGKWRYRGFIL